MATCVDCENWKAIGDGTTGECHFSPPMPLGEYRKLRSSWPIVQATDVCGQLSVGVHLGTTCSGCVNYTALNFEDSGSCLFPNPHNLCADGECHANPPIPLGDYRGAVGDFPRVMANDYSCKTCYVSP